MENGYPIDWTSLILTGASPVVVLIASIISNRLSKNAMSIIFISVVYQMIHLVIWGFLSRSSTVFDILGPVISAVLMMLTVYLLRTYLPSEKHTWLTVLLCTEAVLSVILSVYTLLYRKGYLKNGVRVKQGNIYLVMTPQKTGAAQASTDTAQASTGAQPYRTRNVPKDKIHFAILLDTYVVFTILALSVLCGIITGHSYLMNHVYKGNITEYPRAFKNLIATIFFGSLIICYYIVLILTDGGYIRNNQYLKNENFDNQFTYCDQCSTRRPLLTIHCTTCNKCVEGYDHHCVWFNKCVGCNNINLFHFVCASIIVLALLIVSSWLVYLKDRRRLNTDG